MLAIIKSCEKAIEQKYDFNPYKESAADKIVETGYVYANTATIHVRIETIKLYLSYIFKCHKC